jgi:hypothetical protein
MKRVVFAVVFFFLVPALLYAVADAQTVARYKASGEAGFGKDIFRFKSAIARWKASEKTLEVGFFPVEVNDEDTQKVEEWHMMFYAIAGKKSPDPAKWNSPPYIIVMLKFHDDRPIYTVRDVSNFGLNVVKAKGQSTTGVFLSESEAAEIIRDFQFVPAKLKSLRLKVDEIKDRSQLEGFRYKAMLVGK